MFLTQFHVGATTFWIQHFSGSKIFSDKKNFGSNIGFEQKFVWTQHLLGQKNVMRQKKLGH